MELRPAFFESSKIPRWALVLSHYELQFWWHGPKINLTYVKYFKLSKDQHVHSYQKPSLRVAREWPNCHNMLLFHCTEKKHPYGHSSIALGYVGYLFINTVHCHFIQREKSHISFLIKIICIWTVFGVASTEKEKNTGEHFFFPSLLISLIFCELWWAGCVPRATIWQSL